MRNLKISKELASTVLSKNDFEIVNYNDYLKNLRHSDRSKHNQGPSILIDELFYTHHKVFVHKGNSSKKGLIYYPNLPKTSLWFRICSAIKVLRGKALAYHYA